MTGGPWEREEWLDARARDDPYAEPLYDRLHDVVWTTCQGCGFVARSVPVGAAHNCHRNGDGTYEEGGTFQ